MKCGCVLFSFVSVVSRLVVTWQVSCGKYGYLFGVQIHLLGLLLRCFTHLLQNLCIKTQYH